MKVSEAFLVNTKNFESILNTLVHHEAKEPIINSALLEDLCFSDPNDLLVIRILKDFKVIDNDGKPGLLFEEFKNPHTTKIAMAKGLITAYETLFEVYPKIHQAPLEKIKEAFEDIFQGKKTDLIIKYISGTFQKIVSYTGVSTIDKVLKGMTVEVSAIESKKNGFDLNSDTNHVAVSNNNLDDLIEDFKPSEPDQPTSETNDMSIQEFVKDETDTKLKNEESDDDPFSFEDMDNIIEDSSEDQESKQIDIDPIDLDIPLSSATQTNNDMKELTKEHQFVQKALLRKSDLLQKMNRWEDLIPTLEEIIKRYDNKEHEGLQDVVSRSVIRRATAFLKLNRINEALPALNSVIARFKDSDTKEFYDQASRAMLFKANILEKSDGEGLLPLYNTIIARLDSSSELLLKEKLDDIHLKRFDLITKEGENAEILDACSKLIKRFKDRDEYLEYLQKAMIIRAEMLDEMGYDEEALAAYDQFLSAFSG